MATQRCPKCKSTRVRQGYRPTPLFIKMIFRYNLLCDQCNWEFRGFAIPGTLSRKTKKKKNLEDQESNVFSDKSIEKNDKDSLQFQTELASNDDERNLIVNDEESDTSKEFELIKPKNKVKKRVRVKLH